MAKEAKDFREEEADQALVEEATKVVIDFIEVQHTKSIAVGRYLIEKFYDNDFEYARKGKKVKGKSLNKMLDDLQELPNTPSKSWFYNTINLAVDDKAFKYNPDYGKLNLTQKICLTYLNKKEKYQAPKLDLIKKIAEDEMPIKNLMERIAEIKAQPGQEWPSWEVIQGMVDKDKKKCTDKATRRQKKLQLAIGGLRAKLDKQEVELAVCQDIINLTKMTADSRSEQLADQPDEQPAELTNVQPVNQTEEQSVEENEDNSLEAA